MSGPWLANVCEAAASGRGSRPAALPADLSSAVCISITDPGRVAQLPEYAAVLRLEFDDFEPGGGMYGRRVPADAVLFTPEQADQVADFALAHRGEAILVHCAAGVSRSAAVVEALLYEFPEYQDRGGTRYANPHVKRLVERALRGRRRPG